MLENARRIAESGKTKLSIRVPVIPTFNDTPEEIKSIAVFADKLPGVEEIYLLPYHRLGQDKYEEPISCRIFCRRSRSICRC